MGLGCSSLTDIESNEYLKRFCGEEAISPNDPIWNKLFSHSVRPILTKDGGFMLDSAVDAFRTSLLKNNIQTGNLVSLVKVFCSRASELNYSVQTSDNIFIWQAYNALFIIRNISKYLIEFLDEASFMKHFNSLDAVPNEDTSNGSIVVEEGDALELLMDTLCKIISDVPLHSNTYVLHLETVNTLIVLLSAQMFWAKPALKLVTYRTMMTGSPASLAPKVTLALLKNFNEQMEPPYSTWNNGESGSIVIGVASGLWNMLRKGVGLGSTEGAFEGLNQHNLSNQSLHLLLILINHCTTSGIENTFNPYREAVVTFGNECVDTGLAVEFPLFKLSYSKLFETICKQMLTDDTTLLLYFLLHRNCAFKSYVMARSDIEYLVVPILKTLYNAPSSTSYHIYMSLIVMLILSEDQLFNHHVHDIIIKSVPWYTERRINEISLGGLIILVVLRTIQYNILKMRDKYLHTNCLAALANMSSRFRNLHPYVSQRLISVFETLAKRHAKLLERFQNNTKETTTTNSGGEETSEMLQDINVLEEVIRMLLEILNSVFTHQLSQNKHLVYSLLYKQEVFDSFRNYDATQDLIYNLDVVIQFFTKRIGPDSSELAVQEVMERIEKGALHWSPEILRKFPDLKFRYVEEEQPENFFIPYVWSLIYRNSGLYWSSLNLTLFSLDGEYVV